MYLVTSSLSIPYYSTYKTIIPALGLFGSWNLDFSESKFFHTGPESLMEKRTTTNIYGNLVANLLIVYLLTLILLTWRIW